jgi:RNA polymerase sigma-70 factor, ECF subfamily
LTVAQRWRHLARVGPSRRTGRDQRESKTRTLGDLLYADDTKVRVPERHWIGLVQSIAGGDQHALYALYEQAHRLVFTLMVRITNDRATAEELTVDVFHDVWRRASKYDPAGGSVVGWIMNLARSRAIDRLRFEQRKKRVRDVDGQPAAPAAIDPQEILDVKEQGRVVRKALEVLAPAERQAIERAFFGELTYREVAVQLDQPLGTVKTRVRSGLAKLRQALRGSMKGR